MALASAGFGGPVNPDWKFSEAAFCDALETRRSAGWPATTMRREGKVDEGFLLRTAA